LPTKVARSYYVEVSNGQPTNAILREHIIAFVNCQPIDFLNFPVEANLHVQWDLYGTFCIVSSESDSAAMLDALHKINDKWAKYDSIEGPTWPLDVCL
jgi:hypothetical protein